MSPTKLGAALTEQILAIPGLGKLLVDGVFNRDCVVVQGVVLVSRRAHVLLNSKRPNSRAMTGISALRSAVLEVADAEAGGLEGRRDPARCGMAVVNRQHRL